MAVTSTVKSEIFSLRMILYGGSVNLVRSNGCVAPHTDNYSDLINARVHIEIVKLIYVLIRKGFLSFALKSIRCLQRNRGISKQ